MFGKVVPLLLVVAPVTCEAAFYTATDTVLDAATGKVSWEGPNDYQNLSVQSGSHSANSAFSYFSDWSLSTVDCSAGANALLGDSLITLSASNSSNGYDYNYTQAAASASISFTLPASETFTLTNSSSAFDPGQVSWTLTGPNGWTWTAPLGSLVTAPAGDYTFSVSASVARMAGEDFASDNSATLQFAPEPAEAMLLMVIPVVLGRRRGRRSSKF